MREEVIGIASKINANYTIRQAIDWYKKVYRNIQDNDPIADVEGEFINTQFGVVIRRTAKGQKLPLGPLGQFVASVAIAEYAENLVRDALDE